MWRSEGGKEEDSSGAKYLPRREKGVRLGERVGAGGMEGRLGEGQQREWGRRGAAGAGVGGSCFGLGADGSDGLCPLSHTPGGPTTAAAVHPRLHA